jgi:hypothetical protein
MNQGGKRVSVKSVVASVIRNLEIPDASRNFYAFVEWAFEAERKIGSYQTFVRKFTTLTVNNKQASLPSDYLSIIDIKNSSGTDSSSYFESNSATFPDNTTRERRYYLTDSTINLSTSNASSIDISYYAIDSDDEGFPTIAANHEDAVSAYLMWKYKSRDYYNGKIPRYIYLDMKQNWSLLCAQARGNDNMPTANEMNKAAKIWNTLIPIKSYNGLLNI